MSFEECQYGFCAVFGDIIGSRKIPDRSDLQKRILLGLDKINTRFSGSLIAPFRFVAGDEVRGLLRDECESYAIIKLLQNSVHPHQMRFAVGIGEISTELSSDIAALDGPAPHRASSAMMLLKSRKRSYGRTVCYCSENTSRDEILNTLTFLVNSIESTWTKTVKEKAELLSSGLTLVEVGEKLGISHQAVRKSIIKAGYHAAVEGEALINSLLHNPNK